MKKLMFFALALLVVACEKPILDSEDSVVSGSPADANVILHMTQFEASPLTPLQRAKGTTRAATDITELCSRLNIAHNCDGSATITSEEKVTIPVKTRT